MASTKKIKESLIKQLEDKGANVEHFLSLIDDYLWYWTQEREMQKDVKARGRTYKSVSASGYECEKENPSVKNALMYNKQKLSLLKELALNTENVIMDDDNEL
ncbi:P27 family phage terminase small subunit [Clostridium sp.]|uniref:P27 family phage terminase small subunit n=1 Tax=Clostridium sp. TaxID=1506 RepID=UPI00261CF9B4|nr:P27 family phage terminase small subunit [Clostridium sp.]